MSHGDGTGPDPLKLPDEGLPDLSTLDGLPTAEFPLAATAFPTDEAPAATETEAEPAGRKKKREKKRKDRKEREAVGVEAPEDTSRPSFLARICQVSPYTVMLAVAAAALLIGIAILVLELKSYDFKLKP